METFPKNIEYKTFIVKRHKFPFGMNSIMFGILLIAAPSTAFGLNCISQYDLKDLKGVKFEVSFRMNRT